MSQRTTVTKVQNILGNHYDSSTDLQVFVDTAVAVTDKLSSLDTGNYLTSALKKQIETYLAAHYYLHHDQQISAQSVGKSKDDYAGKYGMGLKSTRYGQSALDLDVSGKLATMGKPKARIGWLGLPPSEQTDYEDRD